MVRELVIWGCLRIRKNSATIKDYQKLGPGGNQFISASLRQYIKKHCGRPYYTQITWGGQIIQVCDAAMYSSGNRQKGLIKPWNLLKLSRWPWPQAATHNHEDTLTELESAVGFSGQHLKIYTYLPVKQWSSNIARIRTTIEKMEEAMGNHAVDATVDWKILMFWILVMFGWSG